MVVVLVEVPVLLSVVLSLVLSVARDCAGVPCFVASPFLSLLDLDTLLFTFLTTGVFSAVLLVWAGCIFVKRVSPSLLCSGREYVSLYVPSFILEYTLGD